jgi:hypothetical protein
VVIEHRLDALLPLAALVDERVAQPNAGAQLEQVLGRNPRLRQPPDINSSRRCRASARSLLARFLVPRRAAVSAGSARRTVASIAWNSSTTNRQPVVASSATSSSWPRKPAANARTPARSPGAMRLREISPVAVFSQSAVICARCWSSPITIVTWGLLKLHGLHACAAQRRA